jgi:hypothetical protein
MTPKFSELYNFLARYPAHTTIRVRLIGDTALHDLTTCGLHRAKIQAILASYGDGPYRPANDLTGYVLVKITEDETGPILVMRIVQISREQSVAPKPDAN